MVGAQYVERLLGGVRYAAVYLISALGGSVVYLVLAQPPTFARAAVGDWGAWGTATVGASGAVFGLFGAFLVLNRHLGRSSAGMYATILINAVIGFVVPGIAWQAHLGGLITGALAAAVITRTSSPERRRLQWPGLALIVVLLVVMAMVKYAVVPGWAVVS
jgi:membrane associated rhomboid family serine protease